MRKYFYFLAAGALTLASCTSKNTEETKEPITENYTLDVEQSKLDWVGSKKIADYKHEGQISFVNGSVETIDGNIASGSFKIDMNSIKVTDATPADKVSMLEGHLKADDFFNISSFPTAEVTIGEYRDGKLPTTVKLLGVDYKQDVPVTVSVADNKMSVHGEFTFNFDGIKSVGFGVMEDGEQIKPEFAFKLHLELKK